MVSVGPELGDHLLPPVRDLPLDVVEDNRLRLLVHDNLTTGRQERESALDLSLEATTGLTRQRTELQIEAKLLAVISHEVKDGEDGLGAGSPQASTQLLEKHCRALR